jgi:chromosomal replication initiation ATPase DnaA
LAPELEAIKKEVSNYYGVEQSELMKSRRGHFNEPRSMAVYLARMMRKDTLMDISAEFNLGGYSSASSVIQGIKIQFEKNSKLKERYIKLKKTLLLG